MENHSTSSPASERGESGVGKFNLRSFLKIPECDAWRVPTVKPHRRRLHREKQGLVQGHLHRPIESLFRWYKNKALEHWRKNAGRKSLRKAFSLIIRKFGEDKHHPP